MGLLVDAGLTGGAPVPDDLSVPSAVLTGY
jgi:hypothetical protein